MIVRVGMAPRAAGTTFAAFQAHWRSSHADAVSAMPNLRRYVQNHAVLEAGHPLLPYPGFDACSEIFFDSVAAMDEAFASEVFQGSVQDDEKLFVDKTRFTFIIAEQHEIAGEEPAADSAAVRLITLWRTAPGADTAELVRTLQAQAQAGTDRPGLLHHKQLVELAGAHDGRQPASHQVMDFQTFASSEAALADLWSEHTLAAERDLAGLGQAVARHLAEPVDVPLPAAG